MPRLGPHHYYCNGKITGGQVYANGWNTCIVKFSRKRLPEKEKMNPMKAGPKKPQHLTP
jgi:hypothetical protein